MNGRLLDVDSVGEYLVSRGLVPDSRVSATRLSGGVSNVVLLVESESTRVVVKQAMERLAVVDDWRADRGRAHNEATALRILSKITPADVPRLIQEDPDHHVLVISAAPPDWAPWKQQLLAGEVDRRTADWLGRLLRHWHDTTSSLDLPANLTTIENFRQLRLHPFMQTTAARRPEFAHLIEATTTELLARRRCLVTGDFSPKNVLVGPESGWVIDFEVAHLGDPAFDVAFLLCHLILKSIHNPERSSDLLQCVQAFLSAYGDQLGVDDKQHLWGLVGCLLLARVVGMSPATYLSAEAATVVEQVAKQVLADRPDTLDELWALVTPA